MAHKILNSNKKTNPHSREFVLAYFAIEKTVYGELLNPFYHIGNGNYVEKIQF